MSTGTHAGRSEIVAAASRTAGDILGPWLPKTLDARTAQLPLTGIFDDSREVRPGGVFVAIPGTQVDGRRYVEAAIERGAAVIVGEAMPPRDDVVVVNVPDAREALADLAKRWYQLDQPAARDLKLLGVTGTNGKSTTAFMARAILQAAGDRCALLGTLHYDLGARSLSAGLTTPGTLQLAECLSECVSNGGTAAVMEVSSHALDQGRTRGLRFGAAAFTNLTQDHLDYHGSMEAYATAKARLFAGLSPDSVAVVNRDDPWTERMTRDCRAKIVGYAIESDSAEITARIGRESIAGTTYQVTLDGRTLTLENAVVGRHNVYNALAAIGMTHAIGVSDEAIIAGLASVQNIPGRLQRVPGNHAAEIFVDYAHTDDALRNVLSVLRPLTRQRLITVFGCGGDRDRGKRPLMAQAAAERSDAIVVTSDNPRTESPDEIIADILAGFDSDTRRKVMVEPDRRAAIQAALACAKQGDVVLIAGKGHETTQILADRTIHFDDVEVAMEVALAGSAADSQP